MSKITDLFDKSQNRKERRKSLLFALFLTSITLMLFTAFGLKYKSPPPSERGSFLVLGPELGQPATAAPAKGEEIEELEVEETETPVEETIQDTEPIEPETPTEVETPAESNPDPEAPKLKEPEKKVEQKPAETEDKPEEKPKDPESDQKPGTDDGVDESDEFNFSKAKGKSPKTSGSEDGKEEGDITDGLSYERKTGYGKLSVVGKGRDFKEIPDIDDKSQENADVFVKVLVNEDGSVFSAQVDYSAGTTTANKDLTKKAIRSAKNIKFKKGDPGSGTITVVIKYEYRTH